MTTYMCYTFFLLVVASAAITVSAQPDPEMKQMVMDMKEKTCQASNQGAVDKIQKSDDCEPKGPMSDIRRKCMTTSLGVSDSAGAAKIVCADEKNARDLLRQKMHPCMMGEFEKMKQNPPPLSPEQQEKIKTMQSMEPAQRKAAFKAEAKKIMQCKIDALS